MTTRQSNRPRVHITYRLDPVHRIGVSVADDMTGDDRGRLDQFVDMIIEIIRPRVLAANVSPETTLLICVAVRGVRAVIDALTQQVQRSASREFGARYAQVSCQAGE